MKTNSVKYNALLNAILNISNLLFPLISFPYIARVLSIENVGKVFFYNNIGSYAIMIAGLGIGTYGIRACALRRDDMQELSKCVKELFLIKTYSSLIVIVGLLIGSAFIIALRQEWALLWAQLLNIAFNIFNLDWFYSGIEQYAYITKRTVFCKLISLLLLFLFVRTSTDFLIYAYINIFSVFLSTVWNLVYSNKYINLGTKYEYNSKQHMRASLSLFGAILAVSIYTTLDSVMLGLISGNIDVGYYTVAVKIKTVLLILINSISTVLLPRLSYYIQEKMQTEYRMLLKKSTDIILMIAVPLAAYFIVEAKSSILLLSGKQYIPSTMGMQILMPILLISGFSNIIGNQVLLPHNMDAFFLRAITCGAIVNFVANLFLIPQFGFVGAAIATLLAEGVQSSIQTITARKHLKGIVDILSVGKILLSALMATASIILLRNSINMNYLAELIVTSILFVCIYTSILQLFKLQAYIDIQKEIFAVLHRAFRFR